MQQAMVLGSLTANILVDGLDNTLVQLENTQLAGTGAAPARTGVGLMVKGGPLAQQGNPQAGRTNLFAGSGSANYLSYQASQGANLLVRDAYYEWNFASVYGAVSDNSSVTFEGSRMATSGGGGGLAIPSNLDAVNIDDASCTVTILGSALDTAIGLSGAFSGQGWVAANNFGTSSAYYTSSFIHAVGASFNLNRSYVIGYGSKPIQDPSSTPDAGFVLRALAQSRAASPGQIMDLVPGVTDARFYHVTVKGGNIGIQLNR